MADDSFRKFVNSMDAMLGEIESSDGRNQKKLLEDLFAAENEFKTILLSVASGKNMYRKFMDFVLKEGMFELPELKEGFAPKTKNSTKRFKEKISMNGRNILRARPYFRERQATFSRKISKAFRSHSPDMLYKFKINYEFAKWVMNNYHGSNRKKLETSFNKIKDLRQLLCTNNLPLAINRAHIFWSKVPNYVSSLEYMDLIQTCAEGLITAIDKFVPPYKTVFRSTAIGRMTLNMIEDHNATTVKLPPKERRILYRAKNATQKANLTAQDDIVKYVNESFKGVTAESLMEIESAAGQVYNLDEKQDDSYSLSEKIADMTTPTDEKVISSDLKQKLYGMLNSLKMIEIKIIKLKMGDL